MLCQKATLEITSQPIKIWIRYGIANALNEFVGSMHVDEPLFATILFSMPNMFIKRDFQ